MVKKIGAILLSVIALAAAAFAQTGPTDGLQFIFRNNPLKQPAAATSAVRSSKDASEMKILFFALFRVYQRCISTQDRGSCIFTVSCSNFGLSALRTYGILPGLLMTSDRLQRCNSLGIKYYPAQPETGLAVDYPLDDYFLGKRKK